MYVYIYTYIGLMTCATCEGQNDVLWLLEDYDALKACSRCGAMLVCLCVDMQDHACAAAGGRQGL